METYTTEDVMDLSAKAVNLSEDLLRKNRILMEGYQKIGALLLSDGNITKDEINCIIVETLSKAFPNE